MGGYYLDLRQYLAALEDQGLLRRVRRSINKDTELHPLVRLQFRGLPEEQRTAFLFENVTDSAGRGFDMPVVVACMAGSRAIYGLGMQCDPKDIGAKWDEAQRNRIAPVRVDSGPVQELVLTGDELRAAGGLMTLPIPISTPGFDNAPYMTAAHFVTRDPETKLQNMGNYRAQLKSPTRLGIYAGTTQDIAVDWHKWRKLGQPMEVAIAIGVTPNLSYVAATKLPHDVGEYEVAGGIAGEPVQLVRCKTVDLEVPAQAEIVVEGIVRTDVLEMEGPFGEFTGYMAQRDWNLFVEVQCITRRRQPVYQAFLSQFPPSESSKLRGVGKEAVLYKRLAVDHAIPGVLDVILQETAGSYGICVVRMDRSQGGDVRKALELIGCDPRLHSKMVIAVDPDIDPRDPDSVNWAISFCMQPHRDAWVVPVRPLDLDYSAAPPNARRDVTAEANEGSSLLIDATRKWAYPPTSLPAKKYMERAIDLWREEGLPELHLKSPWFGYELGHWSEEDRVQAERATRGDYLLTGEEQSQQRRPA